MTEAKGYPGFLKKGFTPFDPLWLARLTEEKVCRGLSRKYTDFYCTGVYGGHLHRLCRRLLPQVRLLLG